MAQFVRQAKPRAVNRMMKRNDIAANESDVPANRAMAHELKRGVLSARACDLASAFIRLI